MDKRKTEKDFENEIEAADNLADAATKEQNIEDVEIDNPEENSEEADNVSEKLSKLNDSYLRLMAEYDNYRKRTVKEKADLIKT